GRASRLAGTASGLARPKCHQTIGAVTIVHATETAAAPPSAPRRGGATTYIASTAENESWKPGSNSSSGSSPSTSTAPHASRCQRDTARDPSQPIATRQTATTE